MNPGPARARAAEERGTAVSLDVAAEYALMLIPRAALADRGAKPGTAQRPGTRTRHAGRPGLHERPDRRPAAHQRPHLNRIRDNTGYHRRADPTLLALARTTSCNRGGRTLLAAQPNSPSVIGRRGLRMAVR
jgi:hypothetical protein